jgi:hypothetical protein
MQENERRRSLKPSPLALVTVSQLPSPLHHHQPRACSGGIPASHQRLLLQQSAAEGKVDPLPCIHAGACDQAGGGVECQGDCVRAVVGQLVRAQPAQRFGKTTLRQVNQPM